MFSLKKYSHLTILNAIIIIYCIITIVFLLKYGINTSGEAIKYINDADVILNGGNFKTGIFSVFYISYSLFIAIFIKLKIPLIFVAFVQILLSCIAAKLLYKIFLHYLQNINISTLGFVFYLCSYPIQKWIVFLYTEGVHTSLIVIGFYFYLQLLKKQSLKTYLQFLSFLLLIVTTRPTGIIFFIATALTTLHYLANINKKKLVYFTLAISAIIFIIILNSPLRFFVNPDSLKRQEIICQVPQTNNALPYNEYNKTGLIGTYKVIKNDIGFGVFFKNGLKKVASFFGLTRPHYSEKHNLLLYINWGLYPFAILGLNCIKNKSVAIFSLSYILLTTVGIFITCDDWSDRFIAPVFPFIIIFTCIGISFLIKNLRSSFMGK